MLYSPGTSTSSLGAGEILGLWPKTNWGTASPYLANEVTFTATPTKIAATAFYQTLGAMASKVSYSRYDLENLHFVLHPRRWFWFSTLGDGLEGLQGRPLVNSDLGSPYNIAARNADPVPYEGLAGRVPFGPSVYIDGNLPVETTAGVLAAGGTQDVALAGKFDDFWLFEGDLRTRVLPEILSGTLEIRYQVFNYVAFLVRYPQSLCFASGTGMAKPEGGYAQVF